MITASALERIEKCPPSGRLPGEDIDTVHTVNGRTRHERLAGDLTAGRLPSGLLQSDVPFIVGVEVAFAYNVQTGEGRRLHIENRAYPDLGDWWIYGTSDVFGIEGDSVVIGDWKGRTHVTAADRNLQVGFLCVAAAAATGKTKARAWLAKTDDGESIDFISRATIDLAECAQRIRELYLRRFEVADLSTGTHCRYCPTLPSCKAQSDLVAAADAGLAAVVPTDRLWSMLQSVTDFKARASEVIYARIEAHGPVKVDSGTLQLTATKGKRSVGDGDLAHSALLKAAPHRSAEIDAAFTRSSTIGALNRLKLLDVAEAAGAISIGADGRKLAVL